MNTKDNHKGMTTIRDGIELDLLDLPPLPDIREPDLETTNESRYLPLKPADPDSTKEFVRSIFKKLEENDSLPAFSNNLNAVNQIIGMKYSSAKDISDVIIHDTALTSKLLALVNTSLYGRFKDNIITTVSDAMIILGTEEIQQAAASLKLFEFMQELSRNRALKVKTLDGFKRSIIAKAIAVNAGFPNSEEFQICAMLYDLGETIVLWLFPKTYLEIENIIDSTKASREETSRLYLGISYSNLGRIIAEKWGLPDAIIKTMVPMNLMDDFTSTSSMLTMKRCVNQFSDEICRIDRQHQDDQKTIHLENIVSRYQKVLKLKEGDADRILKFSNTTLEQHSTVLNIHPEDGIKTDRKIKSRSWVIQQIGQIDRLIRSSASIHTILERIITTLYHGFMFLRVSLCVKNKNTESMDARYCLGQRSGFFLRDFRFKIEKSDDIFNQCLEKNIDIVVGNIYKTKNITKIPDWFINRHFAEAFALFPIIVDDKAVAMLYLDWGSESITAMTLETRNDIDSFKNIIIRAFQSRRSV